jgi:hypothetical protein
VSDAVGYFFNLLERVWHAEAPTAPPPNFARIIKEANGNMALR